MLARKQLILKKFNYYDFILFKVFKNTKFGQAPWGQSWLAEQVFFFASAAVWNIILWKNKPKPKNTMKKSTELCWQMFLRPSFLWSTFNMLLYNAMKYYIQLIIHIIIESAKNLCYTFLCRTIKYIYC